MDAHAAEREPVAPLGVGRFDLSKREPIVEKDNAAPKKKGKASESEGDEDTGRPPKSSTRKSARKSKGK